MKNMTLRSRMQVFTPQTEKGKLSFISGWTSSSDSEGGLEELDFQPTVILQPKANYYVLFCFFGFSRQGFSL